MVCINPLCPKKKFIILDINLFFLPIFDLDSSISGNKEKNKAIATNKILFSMLRKLNVNNEANNPNAK